MLELPSPFPPPGEKAAFLAGQRQKLPGKTCPIRQELPGDRQKWIRAKTSQPLDKY
tara:strand:+ start:815 stop:982 length:168 start_codon:yes stop_codon:yes gene_type:complete